MRLKGDIYRRLDEIMTDISLLTDVEVKEKYDKIIYEIICLHKIIHS